MAGPSFAHGSSAEARFKGAATAKGWKVHRSGWPDFFLTGNGRPRFVEVKSATDKISDNQAEMFEALSLTGVEVFVWWESRPTKLIPWRRFLAMQRQKARRR